MNQYRVTKYNPLFRNEKGSYLKDEWTEYSDVGKSYNESKLSIEEYLNTEDKYISAVINFMMQNNVEFIFANNIEINESPFDIYATDDMKKMYVLLSENKKIEIADISSICKLILRNYIWCKLEQEKMFVHFGYDYTMYIGVDNKENTNVIKNIEKSGLFVEEFQSPYKYIEDQEEVK